MSKFFKRLHNGMIIVGGCIGASVELEKEHPSLVGIVDYTIVGSVMGLFYPLTIAYCYKNKNMLIERRRNRLEFEKKMRNQRTELKSSNED